MVEIRRLLLNPGMSAELEELILSLLVKCVKKAGDVPSILDPIDEQTELAVDVYVVSLMKTGKPGRLTKTVASGLIPRLQYARAIGGLLEGMLDQQARLGDAAATEAKLLEWIFLKFWREKGRQQWFDGKLGGRDSGVS